MLYLCFQEILFILLANRSCSNLCSHLKALWQVVQTLCVYEKLYVHVAWLNNDEQKFHIYVAEKHRSAKKTSAQIMT